MKFLNTLVLLFSIVLSSHGSIELTPTTDESSPSGILVPSNIKEALVELDAMLSDETKNEMKREEVDVLQYHHGLGTWLRNNWHLWHGSELADWFIQEEISTPDYMSSAIIECYIDHLKEKDRRKEIIQKYRDLDVGHRLTGFAMERVDAFVIEKYGKDEVHGCSFQSSDDESCSPKKKVCHFYYPLKSGTVVFITATMDYSITSPNLVIKEKVKNSNKASERNSEPLRSQNPSS